MDGRSRERGEEEEERMDGRSREQLVLIFLVAERIAKENDRFPLQSCFRAWV